MINKVSQSLPQSIEAEHAVLGSVLIDSEAMDKIIEIIKSKESFSVPKHRFIWQAMLALYNASSSIDIVTVADQLSRMKKLKGIGGRAYLIELMDGVTTPVNAVDYASIVEENYQRRKIIRGCKIITRSAYETDLKPAELISQIEQQLLSLTNVEPARFKSIGQLTSEYLAEMFSKDRKRLREEFLETRIANLNRKIVGVFKENLTIISGPPSMGKTAFAIEFAMYNATLGRKILYISLDESQRDIAQRILTNAARVDRRRLYRGELTAEEKDMLSQAAVNMCKNECFQLYDGIGLTALDVRSIAGRFKRQYGLDAIIIDYMQQLAPHMSFETRNLEVSEQCRILKNLAKELSIAIIALSQINRDFKNLPLNPKKSQYGFPSVAMLRDSGTIEQEANLILFVWNVLQAMRSRGISERNQMYLDELRRTQNGMENAFIVVAKQKIGPTGAVECKWDPVRMRFFQNVVEME